jgi:hypothetical protein
VAIFLGIFGHYFRCYTGVVLSFVVVTGEISAYLLSLVDHVYYVNKSAKEFIKVLLDRSEPYSNISKYKTVLG